MADTKLSALTELGATPAVGDEFYVRDISEAASAESKRITYANLNIPVVNNATENELLTVGATAGELEAEALFTFTNAPPTLIMTGAANGANSTFLIASTGTSSCSEAILTLCVGESSNTGDPRLHFDVGGATKFAVLVNNNESDRFTITVTSVASGNDALRASTACPSVVTLDTNHGSNFDYVCDDCGWHHAEWVAECPVCSGVVTWHDDVLAVRAMTFGEGRSAALAQLGKIGVMDISSNEDGTPWIGLNIEAAIMYSWSGLHQNRQRIDADYCCLHTRVALLEEAIGHRS